MVHPDKRGKFIDVDKAQSAQISGKKPEVNGAEIYKTGNKKQSLPLTPELLDFKQTSEMFGVSTSTIRRWIDPSTKYYWKDFPKPESYGVRLRKFNRRLLFNFLEKIHGDP